MKRNRPLLAFFLSLSLFSLLCAQEDEVVYFISQVRTNKGKVPMTFHMRRAWLTARQKWSW